ncbi:MAG: MBOAT family O-acyltransferase [Phycisphaerae bacterium]
MLTNAGGALQALLDFLWRPIAETPWGDFRDFWLQRVFDDRFLVAYFLLLTPLLLAFPRRWLRHGIILTGLAFVAYVFGVPYAVFWLANCTLFYFLSERFAWEMGDRSMWDRSPDRSGDRSHNRETGAPLTEPSGSPSHGPIIGAIVVVAGWYLLTQAFSHIKISWNWNDWLYWHEPWSFPLGARNVIWEPFSFSPDRPALGPDGPRPPPIFRAIFINPHNIGTAYFTIRMLHYFSELRHRRIPAARRTFLNFVSYLCYAPTLMQGPIERYATWQDEMDTCHERRGWANLPPALVRIGWGVLKSLIVNWYFVPVLWYQLGVGDDSRYYKRPEEIQSYALLYFGVFLQIYTLYLEFSGYCDISAGVARLLGYRQIENFDWPWLATSLRDFWRRWHISLSLMLRDHLYIALGGNRRHVTWNLCVTFGLCGVWHIPNLSMLIWGVLLGLMLALNQHWVQWVKRLDESPAGALPALRRAWLKLRPLPQIAAWLLTMHAFVFSLLIFFGGSGAIRVAKELIIRPLQRMFPALHGAQ